MNKNILKLLILTFLGFGLMPKTSSAYTASLFEYDETAIEQQFEELSLLEEAILNQNLSDEEIIHKSHSIGLNLSTNAASLSPMFGLDDID